MVIAGIIATLAVSTAMRIYVLAGQTIMQLRRNKADVGPPAARRVFGFDANGEAMAKDASTRFLWTW